MAAKNFKETKVYKLAYEQAMEIFELTKLFPKEEKFSLTDQVRRYSRSICTNIAEAFRKKRYPAHFVLKVPIVMLKIQKLEFGLIFPETAFILHQKNISL